MAYDWDKATEIVDLREYGTGEDVGFTLLDITGDTHGFVCKPEIFEQMILRLIAIGGEQFHHLKKLPKDQAPFLPIKAESASIEAVPDSVRLTFRISPMAQILIELGPALSSRLGKGLTEAAQAIAKRRSQN